MAKEFVYKLEIDSAEGQQNLKKAEQNLGSLKLEIIKVEAELKKYRAEQKKVGADQAEFANKIAQSETKLKGLRKTYNDAQRNSLGFSSSVKQLTSGFGAMFLQIGAVSAAATALIAIGKQSIVNYQNQEKQEVKLLSALKGREDVQKRLIADASRLQDISGVGDDVIIEQQAYLASLGLSEEKIKEITSASLDLAEATNTSFESAVKNVTKTLGGLTGELGESIPELKNFTAEQLKAGEGIKFVSEQFKGAAAAAQQTSEGAFRRLQNNVGDLSEKFGAFLINQIEPLVKGISLLASGISDYIDESRDLDDVAKEATEALNDQRTQFNLLALSIADTNISETERSVRINKLNEHYREYLPNLLSNQATEEELFSAVKAGNEEFAKRLVLVGKQAQAEEVGRRIVKNLDEEFRLEQQLTELLIKNNRATAIDLANKSLEEKLKLAEKDLDLAKQQREAQVLFTKEEIEGDISRSGFLNEIAQINKAIIKEQEKRLENEKELDRITKETLFVEEKLKLEKKDATAEAEKQKKTYIEIKGILDSYGSDTFDPKTVKEYNVAIADLQRTLASGVLTSVDKTAAEALIKKFTEARAKIQAEIDKADEAAKKATEERIRKINEETAALNEQAELKRLQFEESAGYVGKQQEFLNQLVALQFASNKEVSRLQAEEEKARAAGSIAEAEALAAQIVAIEDRKLSDIRDLYRSFSSVLGDDIQTLEGEDLLDLVSIKRNFDATNRFIDELEQQIKDVPVIDISIKFDDNGFIDYGATIDNLIRQSNEATQKLFDVRKKLADGTGKLTEEEKKNLQELEKQYESLLNIIGDHIADFQTEISTTVNVDSNLTVGGSVFKDLFPSLTDDEANKIAEELAATANQIYQSVFNSISQNIQNEKQFRLAELKDSYDAQLAELQTFLNNGLITEEEYAEKKDQLLKQQEQRRRTIEKQAARRQYEIDVARAIAQTAVAVVATIAQGAQKGGNPIVAAALGAAMAAILGVEIGILRKNYTNYISSIDRRAEGGLIVGPSHGGGGVSTNFTTDQGQVELEGGEYVIRKGVVAQDGMLELLEAINAGAITKQPRDLPRERAITSVTTSPVIPSSNQPIRAYVVETETTQVQRRVSNYTKEAEIG